MSRTTEVVHCILLLRLSAVILTLLLPLPLLCQEAGEVGEQLEEQTEQGKNLNELLNNLKSKDTEVACQAAWDLAETKDTRAIEPLFEAIRSRRESVAKTAAMALAHLGKEWPALIVERMIKELGSPEVYVRKRAIWVLGRLGDKAAVPHIAECLKDDSPLVQAYSAWALGGLKDPRALEPLEAFLETAQDEHSRREGARAVKLIRDELQLPPEVKDKAVWLLIAGRDLPSTDLRMYATYTIGGEKLYFWNFLFENAQPDEDATLIKIGARSPVFVYIKGKGKITSPDGNTSVLVDYVPEEE